MSNFRKIDFNNSKDQIDFLSLLEGYMLDPMGGLPVLTKEKKSRILADLSSMLHIKGFFSCHCSEPIGFILAFEVYSTFLGGKAYNIHDFYIHPDYRRLGNGSYLFEHFLIWAKDQDAVKISLEVRKDNLYAQKLYHKFGFDKTNPEMLFYVKTA
ncbi:GNAT family N-acetyltransferase [Spirochaeta cellobiosiphila]|uniref:GNAT family N-acetyltransferase n=1 Tax=Spirochaeta cellobiosiphila TaxID=504483 RepID=UPI00041D94A4|nr:GNAT family N-acetyltransferase [Spirochaeta cellobiosiphila]